MAAVDRSIKLPDGSMVNIRVPEEWGRDEIESGLRERGMWKDAPSEQPQYDDMPDFNEGVGQPETPPKERSFGDEVSRQLGLTARHVVQGGAAFPLMVGDAANALLNFIPGVDLGSPTAIVDSALTEAGLPEPETATERVVGLASQAVAGAGTGLPTAAKVLPAALAEKVTEKAGMQAAAAASGGASAAGAQEAKLGPVGTLVAGVVGGIAGGAAAGAAAARMGLWADARARTGKPVTTEEVKAVADANGIVADEAQIKAMQESFNKIKEAGEVRQATLEALVPSKDLPVDVARAKSRVAREEFRKVIRGAFDSDAERDDFVSRVITKKKQTQAIIDDPNAPVEVQRARAKAGLQTARDTEIMAEIRARQEALLAKLEAERTTPPTQVIRDAVTKPQRDAIRRNENQYRTRTDAIPVEQTWAMKTAKRMEQIAPRIATAVRRSTVVANRRVGDQMERIRGWLDDKDIQKAARKNLEYKAAILNRDIDTMERIVPGSAAKYAEVEKLIDEYQQVLKANGRPILEDGIHPRAVSDLKKLRKFRGTPEWEKYGKARKALMDKKQRGYLTEHEEAGLISQLVGGHPVKQFRGRTIQSVTPEEAKYYMNPQTSMLDYIHHIEENMAAQQFFKNTLNADVKLGDVLDANSLRGRIGEVLATGIRKGDLRTHDVDDLIELLDTHFGVSRQGPGEFQRKAKDFFTGLTLGFNPLSTATQIADVGISAARFGPVNTIKGLFGSQVADLYRSGLRNAATDFRTPHTLPERFVRTGLKSLGFEKVDKIGNKVAMNAAFRKRVAMLNKAPDKLRKELDELFGARDAEKIMDNLRKGEYSDDVATLIAHDVADIRPISREDMPLHWNQNPKGRIKYSLLSWSINQLNYVRNAALKDITEGLRRQATSGQRAKGGKQIARGVKNLVYLTTMFGLANVPAGITKDLLQGKELTPEEHFVAGMVPFGMSGKFAVEAIMGHDPGSTLAKVVPAYGIAFDAIGRTLSGAYEGDVEKIIQATPTGRSLYRVITGDGIEGVIGGAGYLLDAVIPAADAATHRFLNPETQAKADVVNERAAAQQQAQAQQPQGVVPLPEPQYTPEQVAYQREASRPTPEQELQLRAAIEQEQLNAPPLPKPETNKVADHFKAAKEHLVLREGDVSKSYKDSLGKLTGGIGHLLSKAEQAKYPEGTEIPKAVRDKWFKEDSTKAFNAARKQASEIGRPDMVAALTSVNFQLGTDWNSKFKKTWKLMKEGKWEEAAAEAADSKWYEQTPVRVKDLQEALVSG